MFKKVLSLVVMLSILVLPMAALAEGETLFMRATVADPILTMDGQSLDFTGLELILSGAYDLSDTTDPHATVTAQVLGDGKEALAGAATLDKEKAMGMLNGLTNEYFVKFADLQKGFEYGDREVEILNQFVLGMGQMLRGEFSAPTESEAKFDDFASDLEMKDEGSAEITFGGETVTAQKYTLTLTEAEYRELIVRVYDQVGMGETIAQMLDSMNMKYKGDITLFVIDENNVKMVLSIDMTAEDEAVNVLMEMDMISPDGKNANCIGTMEVTSEGEKLLGDFTMDIVAPNDENVDAKMNMTMYPETDPEDLISMVMDMAMHTSDAFEDAVEMKFDFTATVIDDSYDAAPVGDVEDADDDDDDADDDAPATATPKETSIKMGFALTPSKTEAGNQYEYVFTMTDDTDVDMTFSGAYVQSDEAFDFTLRMDMQVEGEKGTMNFEFGGAYNDTDGDYTFDGDLAFDMNMDGTAMEFTTKLGLFISEKVEGRMLSEADFTNPVDINTMTEEEFEAVSVEVQSLGIGALAVLQQLPGISALIQSLNGAMESMA